MAEVVVRGHQSLSPGGSWIPDLTKVPDLAKGLRDQTFDWNQSERKKEMSKQVGLLTQIQRDLTPEQRTVGRWKVSASGLGGGGKAKAGQGHSLFGLTGHSQPDDSSVQPHPFPLQEEAPLARTTFP